MRRRVFFLITGIAVVTTGAFSFIRTRYADNDIVSPPLPLSSAPEFALKDYEGKEVKLTDLRGRSLVVNIWATWCPFCEKEFADFLRLKKEFGDRIIIIAVNRGEPVEIAKKYTDQLGIANDLMILLDPSDSLYGEIGGFSMPETIFIDGNGFIKDHRRGPMNMLEMKRRAQDAFNRPTAQ